MNIVSHFYDHSSRFPNKAAIISKKGTISYDSLKKKVDGKAAYFKNQGIQSGDRVLIFSSMNTELYASLLALFKIGAVAVIVDKWASLKRIRSSIKQSRCKGIIASGKLKYLSFLFKETRSIHIKLSLKKEVHNLNEEIASLQMDHPALITFTTGSTNLPKAAVRTHGFLDIQFQTISQAKQTTTNDIELIHLPILLMLNLASGSTSYIPQFHKSNFNKSNWRKTEEEMIKYNINTMTCSPAFLEAICEHTKSNENIKSIFCGGGSVEPLLASKAIEHFPSSSSYVVYGSTEAEPISVGDFETLSDTIIVKNKGLYVGQPSKGTQVFIDKSATSSTVHFGEILVKGDHVLDNYLNDQGKSQCKKVIGGVSWHRTGDLGFLDDENLFFTGRLHQWINGLSDSPVEIAAKINSITNSTGIMIERNGRKILCIEPFDRSKENKLREALCFDDLKVFTRLPRDPRHQTKVDYRSVKKSF